MTNPITIAKAGTAAGLATLLLIVLLVVMTGCVQPYQTPPMTVQAAPLGTYNGGYPPAQQMPYRVPVGQPSRAEFIW